MAVEVDWGGGRTRVYDELAGAHGLKPNTLRRMVTAARYALREASACGLPIGDVVAPLRSVEILASIEKESRSAAAMVKHAALRGTMSSNELAAAQAGLRAASRTADGGRAAAGLKGPAPQAAANAMAALLSAMPRTGLKPVGRIGQLLQVDLEFTTAESSHAAFLSPRFGHARLAGRPIEEVAMLAIAATHSYERVHVLSADSAEADALTRLVADMTREREADIDIIDGARLESDPDG